MVCIASNLKEEKKEEQRKKEEKKFRKSERRIEGGNAKFWVLACLPVCLHIHAEEGTDPRKKKERRRIEERGKKERGNPDQTGKNWAF